MPDIPSPDLDRDALMRKVREWWDRNGVDADPGAETIAVDAVLPAVTEAIRAAEQRGRDAERHDTMQAISWLRGHYPTDVFIEDGTGPDATAARFARTLCDTLTARLARGATDDQPLRDARRNATVLRPSEELNEQ